VGVAVEGRRGTEVCAGWAGVGLILGFWGFFGGFYCCFQFQFDANVRPKNRRQMR
jgi:hypothetical protein